MALRAKRLGEHGTALNPARSTFEATFLGSIPWLTA